MATRRRPPAPLREDHKSLPAGLVEEFQTKTRQVINRGRDTLTSALTSSSFDIEGVRDDPDVHNRETATAMGILGPTVDTFAQAISTLAAQFFDDCAAAQGVSVSGASTYTKRDARATEVACRAIVYEAKTREGAISKLADRLDYELKRIQSATIYEAGLDADDELTARDVSRRRRRGGSRSHSRVRFARVPSGAETCEFCLTLGSLGFYYFTRDSAGLYGHNHAHCDCAIVPSFSGAGGLAVPGYDPQALYEEYTTTSFYSPD